MTMTQQWWMQETYRLSMLRKRRIALSRQSYASYIVNVVAGQTHTIRLLGIAAGKSAVVTWGDGLSNEYTGTTTRTHVYASAGTYAVKIYTPENVLKIQMFDTNASCTSHDLKSLLHISSFDWRGNFTSTFDLADFRTWNPSEFQIYRAYTGRTSNVVISTDTIRRWSNLSNAMTIYQCALSQSQIDTVLWELYQINRGTKTGGTVWLHGASNAAPSGTFQPCQSPPVSASTPGKEIAYELKDDSLSVGFNKWATVTTN